MAKLFLRALVPVPELVDSSGRQLVAPSKQLALLVFLASQPSRRATREQVLAHLKASDADDPRASLRQLLYKVRRAVGDVIVGAEELSLDAPEFEYDVELFRSHIANRRLADAAAVYRADFLGTWMPRDAPEMEEWIESQRDQLRREREAALGQLPVVHAARSSAPARAPSRVHPARRMILYAVGALTTLALLWSLHAGDSVAQADFGNIVLAWFNPAHTPRLAVVTRGSRGQLTVTEAAAGSARVPIPWNAAVNPSRTNVARTCVIGGSDSSTVCLDRAWGALKTLSHQADAFPRGWIGERSLLVEARRNGRSHYERRLLLVDAAVHIDTLRELGSAISGAWPSPYGRYALVARKADVRDELVLFDIERRVTTPIPHCGQPADATWSSAGQFAVLCPDSQAVVVGSPGRATRRFRLPVAKPRLIRWAPDGERLALVADDDPPRVILLSGDGRTQGSVELPSANVQSADWYSSGELPLTLVLDEEFDAKRIDTVRWRPFGSPAPRIVPSAGLTAGAFFNNGDGSYESGIALRQPVPLTRGLVVEWWARIPITTSLWQSVYICLCVAPADSFQLRAGPPVTDSISGQILYAEFPNPHGPAERQMRVTLFGDLMPANSPLPPQLTDGRWHNYRLTLSHDGQAWLSADGSLLAGPARVDVSLGRMGTLLVQGRSSGTTVLVDQLRVWLGPVSGSGLGSKGSDSSGASR